MSIEKTLFAAAERGLSLIFASPSLVEMECAPVEQMCRVNALCVLLVWTRGDQA